MQPLQKCLKPNLSLWIVGPKVHEYANASYPLRLVSERRPNRPCRNRADYECDEVASFHSITSSARVRSVGGNLRPIALAVRRLINSSYLFGA